MKFNWRYFKNVWWGEKFKKYPFLQARLKLTFWYMLIFCTLIAFFTYLTLDARNAATVRVYRVIEGAAPGSPQVQEFSDRYNNLTGQFRLRLFVFDAALIVIGSVLAWWLSGVTLKPVKTILEAEQAFVGDVSHSLRTPLATLLLMITAFERSNKEKKETEKFTQSIKEEVQHLKRLTEGLLAMARAEHNVMKVGFKVVNTKQILEHCATLMNQVATAKKQVINLKLKDNLLVMGDMDQLKQVVFVLLDNAIKYGGEGNEIVVKNFRKNNEVIMQVSDHGKGIDPNKKDKLFKRFSRADSVIKGTGLGLNIAKALINAHGGHIQISSRPNFGTKVEVFLRSS